MAFLWKPITNKTLHILPPNKPSRWFLYWPLGNHPKLQSCWRTQQGFMVLVWLPNYLQSLLSVVIIWRLQFTFILRSKGYAFVSIGLDNWGNEVPNSIQSSSWSELTNLTISHYTLLRFFFLMIHLFSSSEFDLNFNFIQIFLFFSGKLCTNLLIVLDPHKFWQYTIILFK